MDAVAQYRSAMGPTMEEDCFLTIARSIVDDVLERHGIELRGEPDEESEFAATAYIPLHAA